MAASLQCASLAWPELLKAACFGLAASLAVSKIAASEFAAARHSTLTSKSLILTSGAVAAAIFFTWRRPLLNNEKNRGKGKFRVYPALRGSDDNGGFTATSIQVRLPRIIDDIIATTPALPAAAVHDLHMLRSEISSNGVITQLPATAASSAGKLNEAIDTDKEPEWPSYDHEPFIGQSTWQSARWFVCETYFYRKIRAIMKAHGGPVDPFSAQKQSLLDSLRLPFERHVLALFKSEAEISDAISQSLLGNKGDLSLHSVASSINAVSSAGSLIVLSDQRAEALQRLHPTARVAIILDNCGIELISDLMLVVLLLKTHSCASVHLLCKKRPVWVSDVLEKDIHEHLAWAQSLKFDDEHTASANFEFVARFRTGLLSNQITIVPHEFLSGPEAFDEMPSDLISLFGGSSLVICKGDANYRRLLGDRHVPRDAPFSLLTDYFPSPLLALRTCKAGLICGVPPAVCARAEHDWLVSGRYAVIQFKP